MGRKTIGPLEIYRRQRGMRQYDLARAAGVSTSYISELESGARTGTVEVWKKIADALGTGLDDLLTSEAKLSGIDRPLIALTKTLPLYDKVLEYPPDQSSIRPDGEIETMAHLWGPDRYVLRCHDQTMFPTLREGDLVLVEARDKIPLRQASGRICVVLHEGKATIRKVLLSRDSHGRRRTVLEAENPLVPPVEVGSEEEFKICGICVSIVERHLQK